MNGVLTVARREIQSFFMSPIAYVVMTGWLFVFGLTFYALALFFTSQPPGGGQNLLQAFFGGTTLFWLPLLIFTPLLTMRLLAEERSSGTIETLMTAPITEVQIVLGKFLAALSFWIVLWLPTLSYVWLAARTGTDVVDFGAIGSAYLGLLCIGAFYMAVGLLMSAVASNQIIAAVLTFMVLGVLFVVGLFSYATLNDQTKAIFEYVGLWTQMSAFSKGIIDTRHVVFDVSCALISLFLAVRVLQANRWQT
jgi:gliding motility-associated transport system permease protein